MSPEVATPDTADVIRRVLMRRFPRGHATMAITGDLVRVPQAPEDDLLFRVTLHGRTARLQRLDPYSEDAWPGAQPEDIPIPEVPPEPVASATPAPSLTTLAERLTQATASARSALQSVATSADDEVARLRALCSTYSDPGIARSTLSTLVAQGLSAYLGYENVLSEALRALEQVHAEQAARATALAALRTSDNLATLGQAREYEAQARAQRLGLFELDAAVRDAAVFREALCATAARLACASLKAAAGLRVTEVTTRLTSLKAAVQALRADALTLPETLLASTEHFADMTGRALPKPRLYWRTPKDPWAGPEIVDE